MAENCSNNPNTYLPIRCFHVIAAFNNLGSARIKYGKFDDGIACLEAAIQGVVKVRKFEQTGNTLSLLHFFLHLESKLLQTTQISADQDENYLKRVESNGTLDFSVNFCNLSAVEELLQGSNVPIGTVPIQIDSSELIGISKEIGLLAAVSLYNAALAFLMKSRQYNEDLEMMRYYLTGTRFLFMGLLEYIELQIHNLKGGDIHFLHSLSVSLLVFKCLTQISIEEQDLGAASTYVQSLQCTLTIARMWSQVTTSYWETLSSHKSTAAAA